MLTFAILSSATANLGLEACFYIVCFRLGLRTIFHQPPPTHQTFYSSDFPFHMSLKTLTPKPVRELPLRETTKNWHSRTSEETETAIYI
jgi:hypothetical protein